MPAAKDQVSCPGGVWRLPVNTAALFIGSVGSAHLLNSLARLQPPAWLLHVGGKACRIEVGIARGLCAPREVR